MKLGEYLLTLLEAYGMEYVFGIPGVHTAELYRGFASSRIRHITPRHEQGAGFMADGYARVTGRPGVCFVITGPGVTNIATAMAQAFGDSIPMLVISGVAATGDLGRRRGKLHELQDQQGLASKLTQFSHTLTRGRDLGPRVSEAFYRFASQRPRPIHIEIPLDVMERNVGVPLPQIGSFSKPELPETERIQGVVRTLERAKAPVILLGGGAQRGKHLLASFAQRLDAPTIMTVNGRGLLPTDHPLALPASPSLEAVRKLIRESDVVLAIGTEFGETDYDMYGRGGFSISGELIRIDIDLTVSGIIRQNGFFLAGDVEPILRALLLRMSASSAARGGAARTAETLQAALAELSPAMRRHVAFLTEVRAALPGAVIVGDFTQIVYAGNLYHAADGPSSWFNSATGYGTLGYALPAAIGAKLGAPERSVVCLVGDGGLQFTLAELGSAIDAGTPIIVLLFNNRGYGEIKSYMQAGGIAPEGVDLATPDFCALARAYGWHAERLTSLSDIAALLQAATARPGPTLIEIEDALFAS